MQTLLLFLNMGGYEILLIVLVILIFFGAKKIPELARGMGRGIREFKDATREITTELEDSMGDSDKPKAKTNTTNSAPVSNSAPAPAPAPASAPVTSAPSEKTNSAKA